MNKRESKLDRRKKSLERQSKSHVRDINLDKMFLWVSVTFAAILGTVIISSIVFFHKTIKDSEDVINKNVYKKYSRVYAMIVCNMEDDYKQSVYESALKAAQEKDAYVVLLGKGLDKEYSKNDLLRMAINANYDGIILEGNGITDNTDGSTSVDLGADDANSAENEEFNRLIREANSEKKKVPIVTINEDITTTDRVSYVCVNRYILGREYGKQLCQYVTEHNAMLDGGRKDEDDKETKRYSKDNKCIVKILADKAQSVGNLTTIMSGIKGKIAESQMSEYFDIENIAVDNEANYVTEEQIKNLIIEEEDIRPNVLVCLTEKSTISAYRSVVDNTLSEKIQIMGFYYLSTMKEAIMKQSIKSFGAIDTDQMGYYAVNAFDEYLNTGYTSNMYMADLKFVTKDNIPSLIKEGGSNEDETD